MDEVEAEEDEAEPLEQALLTVEPDDEPTPVAEHEVHETIEPSAAAAPGNGKGAVQTSLRVHVNILDQLMNLAGELVLARNQLLQTVEDEDHKVVQPVSQRVDAITSELQATIMQTRMQPLARIFSMFPRLVRDLSRTLGKKVRLEVEGQEVELDKTIVEGLADPLVHVVRNAMDHGLETPAERKAAGKPGTGLLRVHAYHEAGQVNIEISDDGHGIDRDKIKARAVAKGFITKSEAEEMTGQQALELVFRPGFSTAEKVSEVSGRGVGMDVVRSNLEQLGGVLDFKSVLGEGTVARIKLPLTMAIIPSLIVRLGQERYAVPQLSLLELVRVRTHEIADRLDRVGGAEVLRLREHLLPLVRLANVLQVPGWYRDPKTNALRVDRRSAAADRRAGESDGQAELYSDQRSGEDRRGAIDALNILVLSAGDLEYGLIVDELLDTEEIVVKPLGRHLKEIPCYAGATIMGDGRVAPIIDVGGLAEQADLYRKGEAVREARRSRSRRTEEHEGPEQQKLLVFRHGPENLFAVPIGLVARIERIRRDSIETSLGRRSIQYRGGSLRLIMLETHLPVEPLPDSERVFVVVFEVGGQEIGLVVGQLVDEKQVPFEVDSHTHRRPGIMGSMIIDGRTVLVMDVYELVELEQPEFALTEFSDPGGSSPVVLLVEDSDFFRDKVSGYLRQAGFTVVTAINGREGLGVLQSRSVDMVITDIEMPVMDGYEMVRLIRADQKLAHLKVAALTSLAGDQDMARGLAAGVDQYLVKLDRDRLIETVMEFWGDSISGGGGDEG